MAWTREKAFRYRALVEKAMASSSLTDAEASEVPTMFPAWEDLPEGYEFKKEDVEKRPRVLYCDKLYAVTEQHKKQADWTPDVAVSLYEYVAYRDGYREIPEHITAVHPFRAGEEGIDVQDVVWVSKYDNNVYTPAQYEANWTRKETGA
jgi:hypothetical protein